MIYYYFIALCAGILFSFVYWVGESFIHVIIFHSGSFFSQVFPNDVNEIWMRSLLSFLIIIIALLIAVFAKQKLQFSEQMMLASQTLNIMRESCLITNQNQEIIYVNPSYEKISGYSAKEVIGKNPNILSSGKQNKLFYQSMWSILHAKGYWEGEIWNRTKSGKLYPEWINISVLRDKKGNPKYYIGVFSDISSSKEAEEKLVYYAYYDPLTNLPNRRLFTEKLNQSIKEAKRYNQKLAVLFLDLDYFKRVNDQCGHLAGDQFLCQVGTLIKKFIRDSDMLSRFGGDEFVVFIPKIESKDAVLDFAKRLLSYLNNINITIESHTLKISMSIGSAIYPDDALNVEKLIQYADSAMYQMKKNAI